jgi:hypothetical protein
MSPSVSDVGNFAVVGNLVPDAYDPCSTQRADVGYAARPCCGGKLFRMSLSGTITVVAATGTYIPTTLLTRPSR